MEGGRGKNRELGKLRVTAMNQELNACLKSKSGRRNGGWGLGDGASMYNRNENLLNKKCYKALSRTPSDTSCQNQRGRRSILPKGGITLATS